MDNLTHSLTGLVMARCGLDRGHRGTAAMLVWAANVPDIDGFAFFTDPIMYLGVHRGHTHGLAFAPLMALLPIALVCAVLRMRPTWGVLLWQWFGCTLAVLSHILWDWTNVYGVRMLLPFSDRFLRLDITDLIDPVIWGVLIVCTGLPFILRLASKEIGARKSTGGKMGWAWVALFGLLGYEGMRWNSHQRSVERLSALLYLGQPAKAAHVFPNRLAGQSWRAVVEGETFYYEIPVDGSGEFTMQEAKLIYKPADTPEMEAARRTRTFRVFGHFNQVPLWQAAPAKDATQVELLDLRFGSAARPGFVATALVEPGGRVSSERFQFGR